MKKLLQSAQFGAAVVLLPLAGRPDLLLAWPVLLATAAVSSIHLVHPYTPLREAVRPDAADGTSAITMTLAVIVVYLSSLLDYAYLQGGPAAGPEAVRIAGAATAFLGFALRVWTVRVLGRHFTARVTVEADQPIVEEGPYRLLRIRHPAYLGTLLVTLGASMVLGSPVGAGVWALVQVPVYAYRIGVEERALRRERGEAYAALCRRTWRLVPFVC